MVDATTDASKGASIKLRTTVNCMFVFDVIKDSLVSLACPGSKAGPDCAWPVMRIDSPMAKPTEGYVPANQYKYYVWNQPPSGSMHSIMVLHCPPKCEILLAFSMAFTSAVGCQPTDVVFLFRADALPSLQNPGQYNFPYYDLNLTCQVCCCCCFFYNRLFFLIFHYRMLAQS